MALNPVLPKAWKIHLEILSHFKVLSKREEYLVSTDRLKYLIAAQYQEMSKEDSNPPFHISDFTLPHILMINLVR